MLKERICMIEAIAFDLDGTLLDSMGMWKTITRTYVESKGSELNRDLEQRLTTCGMDQGLHVLREELGIEDSYENMRAAFTDLVVEKYLTEVKAHEGAMETLEEVKKRGYKISLATASNYEIVEEVLKGKGMDQYFDFINTCDQVGLPKSDPDFYHKLARDHGVQEESLLLLDDAIYALRAGREAGIHCLAVYDEESKELWEDGLYEDFPAIDNLTQVFDYLEK